MKDDFNTRKEKYEEQSKEVMRNQKQSASEFEKEKALMKQKIEYLEKTLEEKSAKEREYVVDWRSQKSGLDKEIKAVTSKHEAEVKLLMQQIDEEKDKASEFENKLAEKDQKLEHMQERLNDLEATYKAQLADANLSIKDL